MSVATVSPTSTETMTTSLPSLQTAAPMSVAPPTLIDPSPTKTDAKPLEDPFESKDAPKGVPNLRMQRGERPEAEIDWDALRTLYVQDEMGNKIKFTDIFKKQKTMIFLVRHFLDFIAKEYVEDLGLIPLEYLQNADVRLVVIGPADPCFIKAFKETTRFNYTLYTDPEREVYKALGCVNKKSIGELGKSKHVKSGYIGGVTSSIWRAMRSSEKRLQGDPNQQGGAFIFGPEEQVHFSHVDQNPTDHCAINDVLDKAGVVNVSFPKDPRVQVI